MSRDGKTDKDAAIAARSQLAFLRTHSDRALFVADPEYQRRRQAPSRSEAKAARDQRAASRSAATAPPRAAIAHPVPPLAPLNEPAPALAPLPPAPALDPAPLPAPPVSGPQPPLSDPFAPFASKPAWKRAQSIVPSFPVVDTPPVWLHRNLQEAYSIPCQQYLGATTDSEKSQAIYAMLQAQQLLLPVPNLENTSVRKAYGARIDEYVRNIGRNMSEAKRPVFAAERKSAEQVRAARVTRLVQLGKLKKAMKVLQQQQPPADPRSYAVKRELRRLFPQRPPGFPMPEVPPNSPKLVLDDKTILDTFYKLRESAAGPSGTSADFIIAVWASPICRTAVCRLINDMVQGLLPAAVQPLLTSSTCVAIPKGSAPEEGIRPITVGEIFTRVASSAAVQAVKAQAARHLMPIQRAVGVKGGLESAIHEVQHILNNDFALLDTDIKNAFNTRHTDKCLSELFAVPSLGPVFHLAHFLYAREAPIFVRDKNGVIVDRLVSSTGSRQGCGMGLLKYCVSILNDYLSAVNQSPDTNGVAIVDNFGIFGPVNTLKPCFENFQARISTDGSQLQLPKCKLHYFGAADAISAETRAWLTSTGIRTNHAAFKYLGAIVGKDEAQMRALALQEVREMQPFFARLSSPYIPAQIALNLLYVCVLPKLNHLLRVCPPSVTQPAAELFDSYVRQIYLDRADILEHELTPDRRRLLAHPIKLGGRGLTSAAASAATAYVSSQALCAPILKQTLAGERKDSARLVNLEQAIATVREQAGPAADDLLPVPASAFNNFFANEPKLASSLHKALRQAINNHQDLIITADCDNKAKQAHHHSLTNGGANLVPTTLPLTPALNIDNQALSYHHRIALRLPPSRNMPIHCHCNLPNGAFGPDPYHSLSCQKELSHTIQDRHDNLKLTVSRWCTQLGARVKVEPRNLDRDGEIRPDLFVQMGGKTYLIDVTVPNPLAPSHQAAAARRPRAVLEQAETRKHNTYDALAAQHGAVLVPFAVETTGGFGSEALAFIKELIATAARYQTVWTPHQVIQGLYRSVAVSVARGNAAVFRSSIGASVLRGL